MKDEMINKMARILEDNKPPKKKRLKVSPFIFQMINSEIRNREFRVYDTLPTHLLGMEVVEDPNLPKEQFQVMEVCDHCNRDMWPPHLCHINVVVNIDP